MVKGFIIILLMALLGGGGFFGYQKFYKSDLGKDFQKQLEHVSLQEEILIFSYKNLKNLYAILVIFNNEIITINKETDRLTEMEKEFPKQINIILAEKKIWEDARKKLTDAKNILENEITAIYVTNRVNQEKGKSLIEEKQEPLHSAAKKIIASITPLTKRLKPKKQESKKTK